MVFVMAGNWWLNGVKSGMSQGGEGKSNGIYGREVVCVGVGFPLF